MLVRWMRSLAVVVCAGAFMLAAMPAWADATITVDDRYLKASADATDIYGTTSGPLTTWDPSTMAGTFNESWGWYAPSPYGAAWAQSNAGQASTLAGNPVFSSLTAIGDATVTGQTEYDGIAAQSYAESQFEIDFTVASTQDYTLSGVLDKVSSGTTVEAKLAYAGGSNIFLTNAEGAFSDSGQLAPGEYTLRLLARANRSITWSDGYYDAEASFDNVQFTVVPEPGALSLLLVGTALAARRRRRA